LVGLKLKEVSNRYRGVRGGEMEGWWGEGYTAYATCISSTYLVSVIAACGDSENNTVQPTKCCERIGVQEHGPLI
jgi:hypothetical protein